MITTREFLITKMLKLTNSKTWHQSHRSGADARGRVPSRVWVFSGHSVHLVGICDLQWKRQPIKRQWQRHSPIPPWPWKQIHRHTEAVCYEPQILHVQLSRCTWWGCFMKWVDGYGYGHSTVFYGRSFIKTGRADHDHEIVMINILNVAFIDFHNIYFAKIESFCIFELPSLIGLMSLHLCEHTLVPLYVQVLELHSEQNH